MRKSTLIILLIGLCSHWMSAQSILGTWKTIDDEDGQEKSYIKLYEQDGVLYGEVIELLPGAITTICENCDGDKKDAPIKGMTIVYGLTKDGNAYDDGTILDPSSGKEYSCRLELEEADKLKVRGYIGYSWLGRTQYWYRVQ